MMPYSPLCSSSRRDFDDVLSNPSFEEYDESLLKSSFESDEHGLLQDQVVALLHTEESYGVVEVPCLYQQTGAPYPGSSYDGWRRAICEWSYRVVDHFQVNREAVGVALNLLDRYIVGDTTASGASSSPTCHCPKCQRTVSSRTFQLAAMAALYIAVKLHHPDSTADDHTRHKKLSKRKKLRLLSFVDLSRGQFGTDDIVNMELKMLSILQYKVHPPTPATVVTCLLQLLPTQDHANAHPDEDLLVEVLQEIARYLAELSVCLSVMVSSSAPSDIAYAAILGGIDMLTELAQLRMNSRLHNVVACLRNQYELGHISPCAKFDTSKAMYLKRELLNNFSPDMLLEDCAQEEDHPIAVAVRRGLLRLGGGADSPSSVVYEGRKPVARKASATSVMVGMQQEQQNDEWMGVVITP